MSGPLLVCHLPNGAPVLNYAPDDFPLAALGVHLAQPDEAIEEAPTALSLPLDTVQEEAPIAETIGAKAETEAGRRPIHSIP